MFQTFVNSGHSCELKSYTCIRNDKNESHCQEVLHQLPAQLLQDDEGSHMCDISALKQGPHAAAGPGAEPHSDEKHQFYISYFHS